jgi:uncharacterized repeat protein (TIGR03803 family)
MTMNVINADTASIVRRLFAASVGGVLMYGLGGVLIVAAAPSAAAGPTETVLHSFAGSPDGASPAAGLIADDYGNLFGTTEFGGAYGNGTVFELTRSGTESVLYPFTGGSDGGIPEAGLIVDRAGNLYSTTEVGGSLGNGTVFKLSPSGTEAVLYSFSGSPDGAYPNAGLAADRYDNLYGTTGFGGTGSCPPFGSCGTVFKLTPRGTESVLHSFTGSPDGDFPAAGLVSDRGNFYGTTDLGGESANGTVFKLSPRGVESVLYSFTGGSDGGGPEAGLITDSAANLYGTTTGGGASGNGVVFKLTPGGTESVLYSFAGSPDGANPSAGLIADSAGNLYGTTGGGGGGSCFGGCGTVFRLTPKGTETVLYSFTYGVNGSVDGAYPSAGLIADNHGDLYSTTNGGGASGQGTVFKLSDTGFVLPFSPFDALLEIEFGRRTDTDAFQLESLFTLGHGSGGIDPPAEPVTLTVGSFTTTIPSGSFSGTGSGPFYFVGTINGVDLQVWIVPTGERQYLFFATVEHANLSGTANPVPVTLAILGGDSGTVSVNATIVP